MTTTMTMNDSVDAICNRFLKSSFCSDEVIHTHTSANRIVHDAFVFACRLTFFFKLLNTMLKWEQEKEEGEVNEHTQTMHTCIWIYMPKVNRRSRSCIEWQEKPQNSCFWTPLHWIIGCILESITYIFFQLVRPSTAAQSSYTIPFTVFVALQTAHLIKTKFSFTDRFSHASLCTTTLVTRFAQLFSS